MKCSYDCFKHWSIQLAEIYVDFFQLFRLGNNFDKSVQIAWLLHPFRFLVDFDHIPFEVEQVNDSVSVLSFKDLGEKLWAVERMVFVAKIGAVDDEFFQILSIIEKGEEYFSNFLRIPLYFTQIHGPQCVVRWNFSQVLEHGPEFIQLHLLLADTDVYEIVLLRQNPKENLVVTLTFRPL